MLKIGNWVQRKKGQKNHRVESVVADDAVVRCGKRLANPFVAIFETEPLTRMIGQPQNCKSCSR